MLPRVLTDFWDVLCNWKSGFDESRSGREKCLNVGTLTVEAVQNIVCRLRSVVKLLVVYFFLSSADWPREAE